MAEQITTLHQLCATKLLNPKWLIAPSLRVGHQWIEALVRDGQSAVNLRPTTVSRLALEVAAPKLATQGLTIANRTLGPLIIDITWRELPPDGYFGRLDQSTALSTAIFDSLIALRLAGSNSADVVASHFESPMKAADIRTLLEAYEAFLQNHALVDEADVLRIAIAELLSTPGTVDPESLFVVPVSCKSAGLERKFLDRLPPGQRCEIGHPIEHRVFARANIRVFDKMGSDEDDDQTTPDGSVRFFRAVGEMNEVREVLRRCLDEHVSLDEVEILHTDTESYVPLIYAMSRRYFTDADRPEGIPVTFSEGLPAGMSRPGRALMAWLHWISEGFPQRPLVEMVGDGLLICGEEEVSFSHFVRLLRPLAIGLGSDNYLPKLDEQIQSLQCQPEQELDSDQQTNRQRRLIGLECLRTTIARLLQLSSNVAQGTNGAILDAAETFLGEFARSVNEFDRYSAEVLIEQIQQRRHWMERLAEYAGRSLVEGSPSLPFPGTAGEHGRQAIIHWLGALPSQSRVLGSGPRPGHLHVAHFGSGGQSGRRRTFVLGLDDRRFPGPMNQDPILLDHERTSIHPELSTSSVNLRNKIDELGSTLSRLSGTVTLSWSCHDLSEDRETFPSSVVLQAHRLIGKQHDIDLEGLNASVGTPVSFAPASQTKALDESERWLWQLSESRFQGTDHSAVVESYFAHLARGSAAHRQRFGDFGACSGWVPQAGVALDPFQADGPVVSASSLETAGRCPLAYFFQNALSLRAPDEREVDHDRWLDPSQLGLLLHDVFRQFLSELTGEGKRPVFERDHTRLAKILRDAVQKWRSHLPPPNENAFRMQYWQLARTARIFLQEEEAYCSNVQPRFFEVAFGVRDCVSSSQLDDPVPVVVTLPSGRQIRARGRVDRVDEVGKLRFSVLDYKIASGYGYHQADPFQQGRRVQSVLYVRMVESALRKKIDAKSAVEKFSYFFPSIQAHGLRIDVDRGKFATGLIVLEQLCGLIADGVFVATDNEEDCRYCDFSSICRDIKGVTVHSKGLLDRDDLVPLHGLRSLRRA